MKIPTKIKIEGYTWSISRKWRIALNGHEALGVTIPHTRQIELVHGLEKDELDYVLIHELVHAILAEKGLYIAGLSPELEEIICHAIGKEFVKLFKINFKTQGVK